MTGTLNKVVIFITGAAIGSAITWKYVKTKYERIAQEEIDSVKAVFTQRYVGEEDSSNEEISVNSSAEPIDIREYAEKIQKSGYTSYATPDKTVDVVFEDDGYKAPYVIEPSDFDELDDYDTRDLTYYADGILVDIYGNIIADVEDAVGIDYASHIGDYEKDAVHIRNDRLKIDYEILADPRNYSDIINRDPYPTEDE